MENGGAFYVLRRSNNQVTFRPTVIITGDGTSLFRDPPLVGIEILPNNFIIKVTLPHQISHNLDRKVNIIIVGSKTMKIVGTFTAPQSNVYTSPRIRRVCPPARFCVSFDFPAPMGVSAATDPRLSAHCLPNGTIQINVPRPAGEVDLRPYRCIRV